MIKDEYTKANNYPLALFKEVVTNDNGEITGAILMKDKTSELTKRHTTVLIPLSTTEEEACESSVLISPVINQLVEAVEMDRERERGGSIQRKYAIKNAKKTRTMINEDLV